MDVVSRALILMYHAVDEPRSAAEARYCVTPTAFRAQMKDLLRTGHTPMALATLVRALKDGSPIPAHSFAISFDDGFECFKRNALPVLLELGIPATLFAVAGMLGRSNSWMQAKGWPERRLLDADELRAVQVTGVTIGCHGLSHAPMTSLSDPELFEETAGARRLLSDALGSEVTLFAYPHGAQGERERRAVADAGFEAACSTEPGFNRLDSALFALRRLDVYGTDDLAGFRRKIRFGANRFTNGDLVRYYINHFLTRFHG